MKTKIISQQPITKGWSSDKKFQVISDNGQKLLLRVANIDAFPKKQAEFQLMKRVAELGLPICRPIELASDEESVYLLLEWIEGRNFRDVIPDLSEDELYTYGLQAGRMLAAIHDIDLEEPTMDWASYYQAKIDQKIKDYVTCSVQYEQGSLMLDFIKAYRHLITCRPITYHHGDFHEGNMMLGEDKKLYIIDFDRHDSGDPWEEFNRLVWTATASPIFASGMINGYFQDAVPDDFWRLLAIYMTVNSISSLSWAERVDPMQIPIMKKQARQIVKWYDYYRQMIPTWYLQKTKK